MIPYINQRMMVWSEWVLKRDSHALGFPRECSYTRLVQRSGGAGYTPDFDSEAYEIDGALIALRKHDVQLVNITTMMYGIRLVNGVAKVCSLKGEFLAKEFGISRDTMYARLHKSHQFILDYLLDI